MKWRDKKDVLTINNKHTNSGMVAVTNRHWNKKKLSSIVHDYNDAMSDIDCILNVKPSNRIKQVALHFFKMFLVNAFHLHNRSKIYNP